MFVNRRLDNSDPLAKISPEILQKIETAQTTIGVATSNNTPDTIVKRDGTGGFSAGTVKATSLEVSGTTKITMPLKDSNGANILQMPGTNNVLVGKNTMPVLTSGMHNIVLGNNSGATNTTGSYNTLIGTGIAALGSGTTGWNTVVGNEALANISGGIGTAAMGNKAMYLLTTGDNNTAIGFSAGYTESTPAKSVVTGRSSTFIGANTCPASNALVNVTAIGYQATVDADNTIQLGNSSVTAVKTPGTLYATGLESIGTTLNIASANNTNTLNIGSGTGVQTINVGNNGTGATSINIGGTSDIVNFANGLTLAGNVTYGGSKFLSSNIASNLTVGRSAGNAITSASDITAIGNGALSAITTSSFNTAVGLNSLNQIVSGFGGNTAMGFNSGTNLTGSSTQNTMIGFETASIGSTAYNFSTAVGSQALKRCTANGNSAFGCGALYTTSGAENVGVGTNSGSKLTTGSNNTFVGSNAGDRNLSVTTGSNNTLIGALTETGTVAQTNATAIGYGAKVTSDNCIQLGNASVTDVKTSGTITTGGLKLPTVGGTAGTLNYYEEYTHVMNFAGATYTASYALLFVRIGKLVTMTLPNVIPFTASTTGILLSTEKFPERFRSFSDIQTPIEISDNSVRVGGVVSIGVGSVGIACAHYSNFVNGRTYLTYPFSMSWVLD